MKIYLAGPFFNDEERNNVGIAETILRRRGFSVFSPRENEVREVPATPEWSKATFESDRIAIHDADLVVALYYGANSDSGTAWECGYAYALNKPVVVVHFGNVSNLMIHEGCRTNITLADLETFDFEALPVLPWTGKMT